MSALLGWKIWYDNGSAFSSLDGTWEDAPSDGVQVVVEFYPEGEKYYHSRNYFILDNGKAYGTNDINPFLRKQGTVKSGRWTSDDYFRDILNKAKEDVLNRGIGKK